MAITFASASSQSMINTSAVLTVEPITMACWFNVTNITANHSLMSIGETGSNSRVTLFAAGAIAGDPVRASSVNAGGTSGGANTSTSFSANVWSHAAGVFTSSNSRSAYLNGGGKVTDTTAITLSTFNRTLVGAQLIGGVPANFADGRIAEAGIWNVALTDDEIAALAKGACPLLVRPASLVAYWPLIGRTNPEICPKGGFNLTLTNGPTVGDHCRIIYPRKTS